MSRKRPPSCHEAIVRRSQDGRFRTLRAARSSGRARAASPAPQPGAPAGGRTPRAPRGLRSSRARTARPRRVRSPPSAVLDLAERGEELASAEHAFELLAAFLVRKALDARVGRIPRHLFDPEMTICAAC